MNSDERARIKELMHDMSSAQMLELFKSQVQRDVDTLRRRVADDPSIIEGEFVEVERRPERLLDAGGSEP